MKMSLIVFGALAVSFLLRRRSAALRHWVLAAGVACAAAMPILTAAVPAWPLPFATPTAFTPYEDPFRDAVRRRDRGPVQPLVPRLERPLRRLCRRPRRRAADSTAAPRSVHLAGGNGRRPCDSSDGRAAARVAGHARASNHARPLARSRRGNFARLWTAASGDAAAEQHPSLLVTWGLARPKVILPSAADAWTDERARVVLSHELAHIRRGDWIVQLSAELLRAFYWFNPLLWVACRRLRLESEHACDDEVMSRGVDGTDYATHLIELARALNQRRHIWFPAPAMARPSSLERRVRAMLNDRLDRGSISGAHPRGDLHAAVCRDSRRGRRAERLRDVQRTDRRRTGPRSSRRRP